MPTAQDLLLGAGLPLAAAFFLLLLAGAPGEDDRESPLGPSMRSIALMAGFLAGFLAIFGWPAWQPIEGWQWLPLLACAAAVSALLESLILPRELHWLPRLALALAAIRLMLSSYVDFTWQGEELLWWPAGLAAGWVFLGSAVDAMAARRPGASWPLVLTLTCAATAVFLLQAHSARFAQIEGGLAAACGGAVLASWIRGRQHLGRGPAAAVLAVHAAVLLNGWFYLEDLSRTAVLLLAAAPLAALFGEAPAFHKRPAWQGVAVRVVAVAIPLAVALFLVWSGQPEAVPSGY